MVRLLLLGGEDYVGHHQRGFNPTMVRLLLQ